MKTGDHYKLLARLFLLELDQATSETLAVDARFASALPENLQEARSEFTRLFSLNVYPYASVFLDDEAVMNGDSTAQVERFYEAIGFQLQREWMVGAPDALGAEFACVAWLLERGDNITARDFLSDSLLPWAPVCCFATERNASLEFYRVLARLAREFLLGEAERLGETSTLTLPRVSGEVMKPGADDAPTMRVWLHQKVGVDDEEHDLRWVINYLLTPAHSGIFLSKDDMRQIGSACGIPVSFGDRGLMLMSLLRGASLQDCLPDMLKALQRIVEPWRECYAEWTRDYPQSSEFWDVWSRRVHSTHKLIQEMHHTIAQAETQAVHPFKGF